MNLPAQAAASPVSDARLVANLLAVDPVGLGGVVLRGPAGPCRDDCLKLIRQHLGPSLPWRRVPLNIDDDRLLGGLDVSASLTCGAPVVASGILAEADGGSIILSMAERLEREVVARICAVMDRGVVQIERNGFSRQLAGRFSVVALDEGLDEDEAVDVNLASRLAFHVDLGMLSSEPLDDRSVDMGRLQRARGFLPKVSVSEEVLRTLNDVAMSLGIESMRSVLLAVRACRAGAALDDRAQVEEGDLHKAIRLVFAHRAMQFPAMEDEQQDEPEMLQQEHQPLLDEQDQAQDQEHSGQEQSQSNEIPEDLVLQAVRAAIPDDMLARLQAAAKRARTQGKQSRGGARAQSKLRGRPLGVRQAPPRGGQRLNIAATLKAAAPWQRLRRAGPSRSSPEASARFRVLPEDFQITRFKAHQETTTIFVVDASGSAAAQRLAEAKGAVELLLAQCYVRRDQVALISFRGGNAELLLPPTRALARAKRELSALPGGGGTPLASGIDAARELATELRRRGQTPVVVMMTDGRANISRDGTAGHGQAQEEALAASRLFRAGGWNCVVVDTANRPRPKAKSIADAMGAHYFPMPYAEAGALAGLIHEHTAAH